MTLTITAPPTAWTAADLGRRFGSLPLRRIRFDPFPGTATEQDVLELHQREDRLYELIDGVLVEKVMGFRESCLAIVLGGFLRAFVTQHNLGTIAGADGLMRLWPGRVPIPDLAFISWDRLPGGRLPDAPIPDLAPDPAVEVLSPGNTDEEMRQKRQDYFAAGTRLVWIIDPVARTVAVWTGPDQSTVLPEDRVLEGGTVLPGFSLPLSELFAELDPH